MVNRFAVALLLACAVVALSSSPAAAQQTINLTLGGFVPRGFDARVEGDTLVTQPLDVAGARVGTFGLLFPGDLTSPEAAARAPSLARHKFLEKSASAELLDDLASKEAFGRAADVWEVAATIAMLASDYTTYLTGEVISISSQRA